MDEVPKSERLVTLEHIRSQVVESQRCENLGGVIFITHNYLRDMERERRAFLTGTVYFVGFGPYVKIGFTKGALRDRIRDLSTGAPEELVIYARMSGTTADEKALHQRFSQYRTRGEWFRHVGELADYIDEVARK